MIFSWTVSIMTSYLPFGAIDPAAARLTWEVLLFATGISMATGVLFGIFPAFHATRPDLATTLKGQAGQPSGARAAAYFRTSLVVVQIALSMGLLACAGLFGKSLLNVSRVDLGVTIDHVITFSLAPQRNGYTVPRAQELFQQVLARLSAIPGVTAVSAARVPLIANSNSSTGIDVEGHLQPPETRQGTNYNEISPGYFQTVGVPLLAGRDFTDADVLECAEGRDRQRGVRAQVRAGRESGRAAVPARRHRQGSVRHRDRRPRARREVQQRAQRGARGLLRAVSPERSHRRDRVLRQDVARSIVTGVRHPAAHRVDGSEPSGAAVDDDAGAGGEQRLAGSDR